MDSLIFLPCLNVHHQRHNWDLSGVVTAEDELPHGYWCIADGDERVKDFPPELRAVENL
jgi:hypothetical protein